MTADLRAAKQALGGVLMSAPRVESDDGTEPVVDLAAAVDAVVRAASPDALVPPRYDELLAPETWHRISLPLGARPGIEVRVLATTRGCEWWQRVNRGDPQLVGLIGDDALHQLGLSACSTAAAVKQLREGV